MEKQWKVTAEIDGEHFEKFFNDEQSAGEFAERVRFSYEQAVQIYKMVEGSYILSSEFEV